VCQRKSRDLVGSPLRDDVYGAVTALKYAVDDEAAGSPGDPGVFLPHGQRDDDVREPGFVGE